VELRNPFLDQDVAEFALSLDTGLLVKGSDTKAALRKTAEHFLPQEILNRKKKGFRVPLRRLLSGPLREILLDVLSPAALASRSLFDPQKVQSLLHEHLELGIDRSKPLWALLTFNIWQQGFGAELSSSAAPAARLPEDICA
jgi:asparagine synthase (glutamine-hydrolysing)